MNNHEVWNELGNLYFMSGAYEPAIHAYVRSIQLNSKFGKSFSNLALAFVHSGKYTEAIKLYRHSIELLPDLKDKAITWNRLGILYRQIKDYKNALEAYQQADLLDPQQNDAKNGVSTDIKLPLSVSMPQIDLNSIFDKSVSTDEGVKVSQTEEVNLKSNSLKAQVKMQWVDDDLVPLDIEKIQQEMASQKEGSEAEVKFYNDLTIIENGPGIQAEDLINNFQPSEAIEKEPAQGETKAEDSQIPESHTSVYEDQVKFTAAVQVQKESPLPEISPEELKAIELDIAKYKTETINNPRNVTAWERLGDAYKSAGMYKEGIQALKNAIANNSTKPSYYYRLGLMYAAERKEAEAILAFQKVLELNPKHMLAHASLGSHYRKIGMDEQAQIHIKQALSTNFANENEYNRACLEAICGNTDRAIELLEIALQTKQTYINWVRNDPDLDSLHNDYRFKTLLTNYTVSAQGVM
jgi:tetratricopeptide (TPR) repeat protein